MVGVFVFLSVTSLLLYLVNGLGFLGHFIPLSYHLVIGIGAGLYIILVHCFIFALFTGSGKDIRLMTQDYPELGDSFLKRSRLFKKEIFPHALYAIFGVLVLAILGGAVSVWSYSVLVWLHRLVAFILFPYLVYVAYWETVYVKRDIDLIHEINERLISLLSQKGLGREKRAYLGIEGDKEAFSLFKHAIALSRFLKFLAWNVWLPFLYLRFIVGYLSLSWIPFLVGSLVLLGLSWYVSWAAHRI